MALKPIRGIGGGERVFPPLKHTPIRRPLNVRAVLEHLQRPGNAITNVINNISFGSRDTISQSFVDGWQGRGAKPDAVAGKVLKAAGVKDPSPATKFLTTLAVSVGTDPITYVPFGKVFSGFHKALKAVPGVTKAMEGLRHSRVYQIPARAIGKAFNPLHDTPKILHNAMKKGDYLTMGMSDDVIKRVKKDVVDPFVALPAPDRQLVLESMEQAVDGLPLETAMRVASLKLKASGIAVEPTKQSINVLRRAQAFGKRIERMEMAAGIDYKRIEAMGYVLHYIDPKHHSLLHNLYPETATFGMKYLLGWRHKDMLHRSTWYLELSPRFLDAIESLRPGTLKAMGRKTFETIRLSPSKVDAEAVAMFEEFDKAMKAIGQEQLDALAIQGLRPRWKGYTVHEIKQRAAEGKLELLYDPVKKIPLKVKDFMVDDVPTLLAIRGIRAARAIGQRRYVDEVIDIAKQSGLAFDNIKDVKDMGMKVEQSRFVKEVLGREIWFDREIASHLDKMETIMRTPQEFLDAANLFDGVQNIWKWWTLVPIPSYHFRNAIGNTWNNFLAGVNIPRAYKIAGELMAGKKGLIEGTDMTFDAVRKEVAKWGVAGRGEIAIESSMKQLKAQLYGSPAAKVASLGEFNENLARIANFIDGIVLKKMTPNEARMRTSKFLFDYQDITPFERNTFRRAFPFYTWTRKNIPLQLEQFIRQTNKFTIFDRAMHALETDVPADEFIPDMLKDRNPVFVGVEKDGTARAFALTGFLPAYDLQILLGRYGHTMMSMLTPIIKAPLEFYTNHSTFFDRALEKFPGQRMNFMGMNMPLRWVNLIRNLRVINEVDRLNPGMIWGSETTPGIFGVTRGQRVEPEYVMRWLNLFTGLRFTPVEVEIMRRQYLQKLQSNIMYVRGQENIAMRTGNEVNRQLAERTRRNYEEQLRNVTGRPRFVR